MASFTLTPVEKGILRCRHTGRFTPADIQTLAGFLREYAGKLLIDLTGADAEECSRHIRQFRPMMPVAAVFGAPLDPADPGHRQELLRQRGPALPDGRGSPGLASEPIGGPP